jgi:hypothetical protein
MIILIVSLLHIRFMPAFDSTINELVFFEVFNPFDFREQTVEEGIVKEFVIDKVVFGEGAAIRPLFA